MVARGVPAEAVMAVAALNFTESSNWWRDINDSPFWQDRIFHILAILYGIVAAVALVQLVRIQLRVPEYGWTTQKVFHFLNFLVNGVRCFVFVFRRDVQKLQPEIVQHILLDMPSIAFFTTYALLVLFWAEIYYQARAVSTDGLRPSFYTINAVVYVVQELEFYSVNQYSQAARKLSNQNGGFCWRLSDILVVFGSHGSRCFRSKLEIAIGKELLNGRFTGSTVEYNGEAGG
ncbi:hypothetical protein SESBI_29942 [Sesbania bispinosa]|nr:hypothetical protein SESBI_29942 [Sesbania bispinosa]